jgi:hypothetical protein
MTTPRDPDAQLVAYLAEGMKVMPDRVVDAVLDEVRRTRQRTAFGRRAAFGPWRTRSMVGTALGAAAVVALLAVGGALYLARTSQPPVGPPGLTPAVSASPSRPAVTPSPQPPPIQTGPIGDGRQIHTATRLDDGRVLIVGGYDNEDRALASAVLYDPGTKTFSPTGALADARGYHTATLLPDGRVLITGGGPPGWPGSFTGITGPFLASAELFDPKTGRFSPTGSMASPREGHTATLLEDGRVLITGGADFQARSVAAGELYDPRTGKFIPTGSMTTARAFHTATLLVDGRVLVAGGSPGAWGTTAHLASAEIYDPRAGTFTPTGPMTAGREFNTATLLADGRVLLAGGSSGSQEDVASAAIEDVSSAEIYDPNTGTFTLTGQMNDGREYHTATLLSDGRVLVVGGGSDYANRLFLASAEIFDPNTGTFSATGPLATARTYQATSLLDDGRVLVTGGYGPVAPLASAEIYDAVTGEFGPAG